MLNIAYSYFPSTKPKLRVSFQKPFTLLLIYTSYSLNIHQTSSSAYWFQDILMCKDILFYMVIS